MTDVITSQQRHHNMAAIHSSGTKPEQHLQYGDVYDAEDAVSYIMDESGY